MGLTFNEHPVIYVIILALFAEFSTTTLFCFTLSYIAGPIDTADMQAVYYAACSSLTIFHILFMVVNTRFYRKTVRPMADVRTDGDLKTHTEIFMISIFIQGMACPWMILLVLRDLFSIGFPLPLIPAACLANVYLFFHQPSTLGLHGNMWSNMPTLTHFPAPPSSFKKDSPLPRLTFWQFIRKDAKNTYDRMFSGDDQV